MISDHRPQSWSAAVAGEIGEAVGEGAGAATRTFWHEQEMPFPDWMRFAVDCDDANSCNADHQHIDFRIGMLLDSFPLGKAEQVDVEIIAGSGPERSLPFGGARDRHEIHHRRIPDWRRVIIEKMSPTGWVAATFVIHHRQPPELSGR